MKLMFLLAVCAFGMHVDGMFLGTYSIKIDKDPTGLGPNKSTEAFYQELKQEAWTVAIESGATNVVLSINTVDDIPAFCTNLAAKLYVILRSAAERWDCHMMYVRVDWELQNIGELQAIRGAQLSAMMLLRSPNGWLFDYNVPDKLSFFLGGPPCSLKQLRSLYDESMYALKANWRSFAYTELPGFLNSQKAWKAYSKIEVPAIRHHHRIIRALIKKFQMKDVMRFKRNDITVSTSQTEGAVTLQVIWIAEEAHNAFMERFGFSLEKLS